MGLFLCGRAHRLNGSGLFFGFYWRNGDRLNCLRLLPKVSDSLGSTGVLVQRGVHFIDEGQRLFDDFLCFPQFGVDVSLVVPDLVAQVLIFEAVLLRLSLADVPQVHAVAVGLLAFGLHLTVTLG